MAKQKTDRYTMDLFDQVKPVPSVKLPKSSFSQRAAAFRARSKFNMLKRPAGDVQG